MIPMIWALAAAAVPPPISLQAQFEQATAALVAEKWQDAAAAFHAIQARPGISNRTKSVVLLREASAVRQLGRDDEARDLYRRGLALAPSGDPALNDDRFDALIALGGIERGGFDYAAARRDFGAARLLASDPAAKIRVLLALASVTMFDDAKAALAMTDEAGAAAASTKVAPEVDAAIRDMRGRILNQGNYSAALAELRIALKDQGGLTSHTDINDVMVRSDLAIAALKAKALTEAREYLAMTGQGRLPEGPFAMPADTKVPPCGDDVHPDDVVVVEFGIGDDGRVTFANPVYASRPGPLATEFARAVSNWSWRVDAVKAIPLFYRAVTRVELRCSSATSRPGEIALLMPAVEKWFSEKGIAETDDAIANDPVRLRSAIDSRKAGDPTGKLPYLISLASLPAVDSKERKDAWDQAIAIAAQAHAPAPVDVYLNLWRLDLEFRTSRQGLAEYRQGLRALLARPDVEADSQSAGVTRLLLAAPAVGSPPPDAAALLQHVVDDKRLDARDPLRVGALVRLSSLQVQQGDVAAARETYLRTGLSAQQCSLVDAQPAVRKTGMGSSDYPMDALVYGIGGWTQVEFDVMRRTHDQSPGRSCRFLHSLSVIRR